MAVGSGRAFATRIKLGKAVAPSHFAAPTAPNSDNATACAAVYRPVRNPVTVQTVTWAAGPERSVRGSANDRKQAHTVQVYYGFSRLDEEYRLERVGNWEQWSLSSQMRFSPALQSMNPGDIGNWDLLREPIVFNIVIHQNGKREHHFP